MFQTSITSFLQSLWHRWPITITATCLAIPTATWMYVQLSLSEARLRLHNAQQTIATAPSDGVLETHRDQRRAVAKAQPPLSQAAFPGFRRIQVAPNEVDYIAEDVTMRVFTSSHKTRPSRGGSNQLEIGDDVTVRYFAQNPAGRTAR
jgi:hypothetical protein